MTGFTAHTKMNCIGLVLMAMQLSFTLALTLSNVSEPLQFDLEEPPAVLTSNCSNCPKVDPIIQSIKDGLYDDALRMLQRPDGDFKTIINHTVHELYKSEAGNFNFVLQLGEVSKNATVSLAVYRTLKFEMENKNCSAYQMILRLINGLKRKIIDSPSATANERSEAEELKNELHSSVKEILLEQLKDAFSGQNYETVSDISDNIYDYTHDSELTAELFDRALNESFHYYRTERLIYFFSTLKYPPQSIFGYSALFNELKKGDLLDQVNVLDLAYGIKEALDKVNPAADIEAHAEGNKLKNSLPISLKNLAFSERVCFRNVQNHNEYLYAETADYNLDKDRRQVFTWTPGNRVKQDAWFVKHDDDLFVIQNAEFNEYLHTAPHLFSYRADTWKRPFTKIGGGYKGLQFAWFFEPVGDYVRIKNVIDWKYC